MLEKYIILGWPEVQEYMTHERWNECRALVSDCAEYAIPVDLYEEIMASKMPVTIAYEDEIFYTDITTLKRDDKVLIEDYRDGKMYVVIAESSYHPSMPILLNLGYLEGINCDIIGHTKNG